MALFLRRRNLVTTVGLAALCSPTAWAQIPPSTWPQRPIRWIVSQPAGAGPDIIARYVSEQLARNIGQPIVVENRPGGQNLIGAQAAARATPDGYSFFYGTAAAMVTNVHTFKSLPYDPESDFVPVVLVGKSPFIVAASGASGFKNLSDALNQAMAQPSIVTIATEGSKTFSGMLADSIAAMAGIKLNHVPYSKASDAIHDAIAGRVALICLPAAALTPYIKSGQIMPLAISSAVRLASLPSIATLAETFAGFEFTGWNGLFAPAGTPTEAVLRINRELVAILAKPEVVARLLALGSVAETGMSPASFASFIKAERIRWAGTAKAIGINPE